MARILVGKALIWVLHGLWVLQPLQVAAAVAAGVVPAGMVMPVLVRVRRLLKKKKVLPEFSVRQNLLCRMHWDLEKENRAQLQVMAAPTNLMQINIVHCVAWLVQKAAWVHVIWISGR